MKIGKISSRSLRINFYRLAVFAVVLCLWEFLPKIAWLRQHTFLDPFNVSSPSRIADLVGQLITGGGGSLGGASAGGQAQWRSALFEATAYTVLTTLLGLAVGLAAAFIAALLLSQARTLDEVTRPFLVAANSVPRVALIPLIVSAVGIGRPAAVVVVSVIVFFVVFFVAYNGARAIEPQMIDFYRVLGAGHWQLLRQVKLPYVVMWCFAALPSAISFALVGAITTEILTGGNGLGSLIVFTLSAFLSTHSMLLVLIMGALGMVLVGLASLVERRVLHWMPKYQDLA
jgi:NitT/TauT family transport system permease protein